MQGPSTVCKECWGFSAPPTLVFFLFLTLSLPSTPENCCSDSPPTWDWSSLPASSTTVPYLWVWTWRILLLCALRSRFKLLPLQRIFMNAMTADGTESQGRTGKASWISDKGGCSTNRPLSTLECAVIKSDVFWRLKWSWKVLMMI